jgi:hypothetical protein
VYNSPEEMERLERIAGLNVVKPVNVKIEHSAPWFFFFKVEKNKKCGEEGKDMMETVETKGGCFSSQFFRMAAIVMCCCNQKQGRRFAEKN